MSFSSVVGSISLFVLFLCSSDVESMRTLKKLAAKRGGLVTIPCLYDEQYKTNSKFWCKGYYWSSCSIVAYANTTGSTSVYDYPEQNVLIVEMNPVSDSGYYWCAAEIGGKWTPDDRDYLYLTVSEDPDLSVVESRVSGAEGGNVTVQCLYSAAYRNTQKQWCRFKDRSCDTVGKTDTSQNSSVHISDDGRSFSVEIRGLKKSDAGWYWCSAGDLEVPVHISVGGDEAPASTTTGPITTHHVSTDTWSEFLIYLVALLLLLVILVIILICILKKKHKAKNQIRTRERSNDTTVHTATLKAEDSIIYSTVTKQPTLSAEDCVVYSTVSKSSKTNSSKDNEEDVTNSSVNIASNEKTVSPNDVDDKTIYSSVVC